MGDDCVALLEKILAETIRLRESMEARDAERRRLLKELRSKRITVVSPTGRFAYGLFTYG